VSLSEDVRPLLAARAATDPDAARLLEMFTRADEMLREHSLERIGDVENAPAHTSALGIAVVISPILLTTAHQGQLALSLFSTVDLRFAGHWSARSENNQ